MTEPSSGFAARSHLDGKRFESAEAGRLSLEPAPFQRRYHVRVRPGDIEGVSAALGFDLPTSIGAVTTSSGAKALCLGPDEWFVLAEDLLSGLGGGDAALAGRISWVEVSDRDVGLRLSGTDAAATLAAGCPLDLTRLATPGCVRTVFEGVQIVVLKSSEADFEVSAVGSFAPYIWTILERAARQNEAVRNAGDGD